MSTQLWSALIMGFAIIVGRSRAQNLDSPFYSLSPPTLKAALWTQELALWFLSSQTETSNCLHWALRSFMSATNCGLRLRLVSFEKLNEVVTWSLNLYGRTYTLLINTPTPAASIYWVWGTTRVSLCATKQTVGTVDRSMAAMVVTESHLWLNLMQAIPLSYQETQQAQSFQRFFSHWRAPNKSHFYSRNFSLS